MPRENSKSSSKEKVTRKTPNWSLWKNRGEASLENAVALSMNIHPRYLVSLKKVKSRRYNIYRTRLKSACLALGRNGHILQHHPADGKELEKRIVSLSQFAALAIARGWGAKCKEFRDLANPAVMKEPDGCAHANWVQVSLPFVTARMNVAFEAMKVHWANGANDNPKQEAVASWIKERLKLGTTGDRVAKELATLIRHDVARAKDGRTRGRR